MKIERTTRNVLTVRFDDIAVGWTQWVLLRSDAHHDHKHCDRGLEKKHLEAVVERDGLWCDFGDLFDACQGKFDPRRSYDNIRPEDLREDYFDRIVTHAAEFYAPYADRCLLLAMGNHETATLKHASTHLTSNLAYKLNHEALGDNGHRINVGAYGGWIRFMFKIQKTKVQTVRLKYFHGAGNTAPVTRGVIETSRQSVFVPDADVCVNGHNHQVYVVPIARERLNRSGRVETDLLWHGRIPGYLDDYQDGSGGWAVEKGHPPTPRGALWLRFECKAGRIEYQLQTEIR